MNATVIEAAREFVKRAAAAGNQGRVDDENALRDLNMELGQRIPEWLILLNSTEPLLGLEIDWRAGEFDGSINWADAGRIRSESVECYPGIAILDRGFVNVGSDSSWEPYFIPTDRGDDPPVFQVYYEGGTNRSDEIFDLFEVSPRLSLLFRMATGALQ